jgi:DNA-binding beta-propeller fold protein YncE
MLRSFALALTCMIPACALSVAQLPPGSLKLEREIPLPGVEGRIDHLSADVKGGRVFVSAFGNGTIEVVDVAQARRTAEIKGLKSPQGTAYVDSNGTIYVASGGDGTVRSFDGATLKPVHDVSLGENADNIRYDKVHDQLLVGYGSGAIAALGLDLSRRANFALPVHPESFQLSEDGQQVFVNLPDTRSIASIDLGNQSVNPTWGHPSASGNFSMALDKTIHRLFIPCRQPARLQVVSSDAGRITAWTATVGDADDIFVDEARRTVYVIGGDGFVDVLYVREHDAMVSRARVPTGPGARTGLYIPEWNKLIVAAPRQGATEARLLVFAVQQ